MCPLQHGGSWFPESVPRGHIDENFKTLYDLVSKFPECQFCCILSNKSRRPAQIRREEYETPAFQGRSFKEIVTTFHLSQSTFWPQTINISSTCKYIYISQDLQNSHPILASGSSWVSEYCYVSKSRSWICWIKRRVICPFTANRQWWYRKRINITDILIQTGGNRRHIAVTGLDQFRNPTT